MFNLIIVKLMFTTLSLTEITQFPNPDYSKRLKQELNILPHQ